MRNILDAEAKVTRMLSTARRRRVYRAISQSMEAMSD